MTKMKFCIKYYEVILGRQITAHGGNFYAIIACINPPPDDTRFNIYFLRPDSHKPNNLFDPTNKLATMYVPAEQFTWYLDILRHERPVWAYMNSENPVQNRIYTGLEPVGSWE